MDQRLWVYRADDLSFWVAREPVCDVSQIKAPGPVLELGTALVEPYELAARTRADLSYAGVARLTAGDTLGVILRMDETVARSREGPTQRPFRR